MPWKIANKRKNSNDNNHGININDSNNKNNEDTKLQVVLSPIIDDFLKDNIHSLVSNFLDTIYPESVRQFAPGMINQLDRSCTMKLLDNSRAFFGYEKVNVEKYKSILSWIRTWAIILKISSF